MDYSVTLSTHGNLRQLMTNIRQLLTLENYFKIEETGEGGFRAKRGFTLVQTRKHHPFQGISAIEATPRGQEIHVQADFGGVRTARTFGLIFIPAMALGFYLMDRSAPWLIFFIFAPWLVIGPIVTWMMRRKARATMDRLLRTAENLMMLDDHGSKIPENGGTLPFSNVIRGDYEQRIDGGGHPERMVFAIRQLIAAEGFRIDDDSIPGFQAHKPFWGVSAETKLTFFSIIGVFSEGKEVVIKADFGGIRFLWILLFVVFMGSLGGVLYALHGAGHDARRYIIFGMAMCVPELLLIPFLPMILRQYARSTLDRIIKAAGAIAQAEH